MAKKRKQSAKGGYIIRVSQEVKRHLIKGEGETYDDLFRRLFGLPNRLTGEVEDPPYWVLTKPKLKVFSKKSEALGASIMEMAKSDRLTKERPKRVVRL